MAKIRIIITGSKGRMGQMLVACASRLDGVEVVAQIDQGDDLAAVVARGDVIIDFSFHNATAGIAGLCAQHGKALVIGTTGHSDDEKAAMFKTNFIHCELKREGGSIFSQPRQLHTLPPDHMRRATLQIALHAFFVRIAHFWRHQYLHSFTDHFHRRITKYV